MTYTRPTLLQHALGRLDRACYRTGLRSPRRLTLPDFLCIGAQKAGTTWLWENLRHHPELYLPDEKEIHYFDWHYDDPLRTYARRFEPGRDRVKGEVTPGYSIIHPRRIRHIRFIMPDVRSILLVRNPIDRAWSHAVKNLAVLRKREVADVPVGEFLEHFRSRGSVMRGDYATILDNWRAVFPEEQVRVEFFERISEQPRDLLTDIFRFLGVSTDVAWADFPCERVVLPEYDDDRVLRGYEAVEGTTAGHGIPDEYREFLRDFYRKDIASLRRRLGPPVDRWLQDDGEGDAR